MQIAKIIFFIISCSGLYLFIDRKSSIKKEFIPIILISTIGVIEFCAGILNFMKIATIIIGLIGFLLAIYEFYFIIKNKKKIKFSFSFLIFILVAGVFAYLLKGVELIHYDNFSHWGLIVKEMLISDGLPNFQTKTITFTAYPPGTACFIYYVCKYLGNTEGIMLFAQSVLILSSIYTIFAFCNKDKKINYLLCVFSLVYLILGNIFIDQLLVDTVIPVMGLAALVIINFYKDDSKKGLLYAMPVLSLLMLVKNSGIFFIIINLVVWLINFVKNNGIKSIFKTKYLLIILIPFLLQFVWNAHTELVFEESDTSKHAMTASNYAANFKEKSREDIFEISQKFVKEMFSPEIKENILIIIILLGFGVMIIFSGKNKGLREKVKSSLILFISTYILYQISMYGMYILSMPTVEAVSLACYIRYFRTIVLFEYGVYLITALNFINESKSNQKISNIIVQIMSFIIVILLIAISPNKIESLYKKNTDTSSIRYEILEMKKLNNIEEEKSYLIYISDEEKIAADYLYYVSKYDFRSENVRVIRHFSDIGSKQQVYEYDYFLIVRSSDETNELLKEIGGDLEQNVIKFE